MTSDEILELEAGNELDRLITEKVMGWYMSPYGLIDREHKPGELFLGDVCEMWSPSCGIYESFEVVMKMYSWNGYTFMLNQAYHLPLVAWEAGWYRDIYNRDGFVATANTVPLAICRAALLAVMETV